MSTRFFHLIFKSKNLFPIISARNMAFQCMPTNEPLTNLAKTSSVRALINKELDFYKSNVQRIPLVINGKEYFTESVTDQVMPTNHKHVLAKYSNADKEHLNMAIDGAVEAQRKWESMPFEHRAKIFAKASSLVRNKYRYKMLAATMLGQGKTAFQADIDAVCELIDFLEFNIHYCDKITRIQDLHQPEGQKNLVEFRPLEGFIAAISPFNFTAIGANLCSTPAMLGNVILWKPSSSAVLSSYLYYKILLEAGLPEGVIQFVPSSGPSFGDNALTSQHLSGINFTGSSATFNHIWKQIAENIDNYRNYPKLMGECGGKNFHFVHHSADLNHVVNSTIRSAFEYSGQKCSACSRIFLPESQWKSYKDAFIKQMSTIKLGDPEDYDTFLCSVIDKRAYGKIKSYIDGAKSDSSIELVYGGNCDDSVGYFIEPTLFKVSNLDAKIIKEEIFGPVLAAYVYPDEEWEATMTRVEQVSTYALTGSIFSHSRDVIMKAQDIFRNAAGNFYINDKCTGSVVGQQPFGGARKSGTNDKPGMFLYPLRFTSPRAIKESFVQLDDTYTYPFMEK